MKRILLFLIAALLLATSAIASPLQVATIVLVYNCPNGYEYVIHAPGDSYLHTCADKTEMNNASTTIDHRPQYTSADFSDADALAIFKNEKPSDEAQTKINKSALEYAQKFITDRDNAPAPVEPTVEELEQNRQQLQTQLDEVVQKIIDTGDAEAVKKIKDDADAKAEKLSTVVVENENVYSEKVKK